jgi:hypothetical protein
MGCFASDKVTPDVLVSHFCGEKRMRSRSVGGVVVAGTVTISALPLRLTADWEREISLQLDLAPGDVESLSLPRARMRWPAYPECVHAVSDWAGTFGLHGLLGACDVALMACRGARYHHDGALYGGAAFCNLFLGEDKGLDLHFPSAGCRIPLVRGTVVIFDTCQPHAVVKRHSVGFDAADFPPGEDCSLVFLTWELPIENVQVSQALGVVVEADPQAALRLNEEQLWLNGAVAQVCPASGRWLDAG